MRFVLGSTLVWLLVASSAWATPPPKKAIARGETYAYYTAVRTCSSNSLRQWAVWLVTKPTKAAVVTKWMARQFTQKNRKWLREGCTDGIEYRLRCKKPFPSDLGLGYGRKNPDTVSCRL